MSYSGNSSSDEQGYKTSGITAFYIEFYNRLADVDSSGKFEAVLGKYLYSPILILTFAQIN
jgi:hypothetical protein